MVQVCGYVHVDVHNLFCSPHIAGQVLVLTEQGEVCVYQQEQKTVVMVGCGNGNGGMCLFGAHSQHILWLAEGRLYSCDMCTDKVVGVGLHAQISLMYTPCPLACSRVG